MPHTLTGPVRLQYEAHTVFASLEHLQQKITPPSPQYRKINILIIEVLQQITNPILITYKFSLVITKTHLPLS